MTAKAFIEGVVAAKDPKCPLASALRLYIANYFRSSAPRYGLVDPASRLAFRIERPRRSRKGSKKTAVEKPPVQDGINNPVVVRQDSNVQVISGKFLGDFQRHYDEKGYISRLASIGHARSRLAPPSYTTSRDATGLNY